MLLCNVRYSFCERQAYLGDEQRKKFDLEKSLQFLFPLLQLFSSFNSFSDVLVSISKGQVSTRTIRGLRLESTHKSGKLICMSKIISSQAGVQSKWLKELLAVSLREKEWKQTRLLGGKRKAVLFWTSPCWVTCWPGEIFKQLNSLLTFFLWLILSLKV